MRTTSAGRSLDYRMSALDVVTDFGGLATAGISIAEARAHVRANRWQRIGRAVARHNGPLSVPEARQAALINCGPRSVLTAFSGLDEIGLTGWDRPWIDVLVPRGARICRPAGLPMRIHYTDNWCPSTMNLLRRVHRPAHAAVIAASMFAEARPACGVLAATVQQRLVRPQDLATVVEGYSRVRHRAVLLAAATDIGQGAHALSEIDLARLCRRAGLPEPIRQAVRVTPDGGRRYLDAEWRRRDGRRVVAEVDGALHLVPTRWWADQLRQNELVLADDLVLRFPTVIVRLETGLVVSQIARALLID
jgi:hypothetical protein